MIPAVALIMAALSVAFVTTAVALVAPHRPPVGEAARISAVTRRSFFNGAAAVTAAGPLARAASISAAASALALTTSPMAAVAAPLGKVVVLGGSGFVGSRVCEQLVGQGAEVVSISRSGGPPASAANAPWASKVKWVAGDASDGGFLEPQFKGASAVISCIGVIFGNGEEKDRRNNAAPNVAAADAAAAAGVKRYVFVSVSSQVEPVVAPLLGHGYFDGKADAERELLAKFGEGNSLIIKPSFIYGGTDFSASPPRVAEGYGSFIDGLLSAGPIKAISSVSPGPIQLVLAPPVSVKTVAQAAVAGALGKASGSADGKDAIARAASLA